MFTSSIKMKKAHRLPLRFEDKETMSFEAYRGTTLFDSMPRIQLLRSTAMLCKPVNEG
ncbi:hypothetical protein CHCC14821_0533 [Bacillus paralicheniformis]|nr:hypothetical protein CHCC14821_0533 [Bacillus paralicheniformis]TWM58856.1 hypothetical protein CHCC14814_1045 [Bacillus paralicheniformis]